MKMVMEQWLNKSHKKRVTVKTFSDWQLLDTAIMDLLTKCNFL